MDDVNDSDVSVNAKKEVANAADENGDNNETGVGVEEGTTIDDDDDDDTKLKPSTYDFYADDDDDDDFTSRDVREMFSKTLSYELYELKDPKFKCLTYDRGELFDRVVHDPSDTVLLREKAARPPSKQPSTSSACSSYESKKSSVRSLIDVDRKTLKDVRELYEKLASEKRKFLEKIYAAKKTKDDRKKWTRKTNDGTQTDSSLTSCTCTTINDDDTLLNEKKRLEYLMGLTTIDEYATPTYRLKTNLDEIIYEEAHVDDIGIGVTESMREAQKYLRCHRIFEFYQYLITHLLSATPGTFRDCLVRFFLERKLHAIYCKFENCSQLIANQNRL